MNLRILVTGGAGYLGSVLCEQLLKTGCKVTVVDNLRYSQNSLFHLCHHPGFEFVHGDARNDIIIKSLLRNVDVIIPLAAIVGAPACDLDPLAATSTNFDAIKMINQLRTPSQLLIYPTTNSGYGTQTGDLYCTEETPLEPISLYGRTKSDAEEEVLQADNTITFRLATVFGISSRMRLDLLVNHFTYAAATDGYIVIFEKDFKRNYVHIRDVADCFIHAIGHAPTMVGRPFNVGLEEANLSKEELAFTIQRQIPSFHIQFSEMGTDPDKRNYIVSNQRLRDAGFVAKRSLEEGIQELLKGYRMFARNPYKNI